MTPRISPMQEQLAHCLYAAPISEVPGDTPIAEIPRFSRTFEAHGELITVSVNPAILRDTGDKVRIVFPAEREQMVAAAIHAIAVRQQAAMSACSTKDGQTLFTFLFAVRQLRAELKKIGHALSTAEVMEALEILGRASATITLISVGQEPVVQSLRHFGSILSQGERYIVTLNASQMLIGGTIFAQEFRRASRARVGRCVAEGRGRAALAVGAAALGIDISKPVKARLVSICGVRLDCRSRKGR